MLKKSKKPGKSTLSKAEVQNISHQGMWILIGDQEFFISFEKFPWFLKATIDQIYNLEFLHDKHLHWPTLDIDIDLDSLKYPDLYPLKYS
jgi:hypothetical protein